MVFFSFSFPYTLIDFSVSRLCASPISCTTTWPPPGQSSSQGKQLMAVARQLLRVTRGVKRRASWGKICFSTVLHLDLKYMPLLSHLQKALIYLKSSQQASVGSRGWEAVPGNTKLPFSAPLSACGLGGARCCRGATYLWSVLSPVKLTCFPSFCISGIAVHEKRPNSALHGTAIKSE